MEPERFGRRIGIGVRVASKMLRDGAERAAQPKADPASRPSAAASVPPRPLARPAQEIHGQVAGKARAAKRGARRFGQAIWDPVRHAGSVLWLEINGLFFALFAVFFGQNIYRVRTAWKQGPEHEHFVLYIALTLLFVWFSASSFLRARRREKKGR